LVTFAIQRVKTSKEIPCPEGQTANFITSQNPFASYGGEGKVAALAPLKVSRSFTKPGKWGTISIRNVADFWLRRMKATDHAVRGLFEHDSVNAH
jgi:hypothetical protein